MNESSPCPGASASSRFRAAAVAACAVGLFGSISIVSAQTAPGQPPGQNQAGAAAKGGVVVLSPFQIEETKTVGYRTTQTLSGSSTVAELRDIPSSISVMNRELMDDLMVTKVSGLLAFSISGEPEPNNEALIAGGALNVRTRGLVSGSLRDGVYMATALDSHNVDRVEILRGPNGFLYTGAGAGGNPNQVTKRAQQTDSQFARFMVGSEDLYRGELDINRRLTDKLAVRGSMAYEKSDRFQNYGGRRFSGLFVTTNYRPFSRTNVDVSVDFGKNHEVMSPNMLSEQYSISDRTGAASPYTGATGGVTLIPAVNRVFDMVGQLRTSGTNLTITDPTVLPKLVNFKGPDSFNRTSYRAIDITADQGVGENLNLRFRALHSFWETEARAAIGSSVASIYRDVNQRSPNGDVNPYFGQLYTEYAHRQVNFREPSNYLQGTAAYDLKLRFTTQRIVAAGHYHELFPDQRFYAEFVDPRNPAFKGSLQGGDTLAGYVANNNVLTQNRVYRRFYLRDGDAPRITGWSLAPGLGLITRDTVTEGNLGRLVDRHYWNAGGSIGSAGTYFNERIHTFVGWRSDSFYQTPGRNFYNQVSGVQYRLAQSPNTRVRVRGDSTNYGVVFHLNRNLSVYGNYGESLSLNVTAGQPGLTPGSVIPSPKGFGSDYGVRLQLLDGRLQSSWTYYKNEQLNGASIPANVLSSELVLLFPEVNPSALDTQNVTAKGHEFETILNLTDNWRLLWNYGSNDLANTDRYPALIGVRNRARAANRPTPLTDAFLTSVPEGVPSVGFTKARSNLITQYRFTSGPLNRVMIGAAFQYRKETYQGNFDLNSDGVAEQIWTPGYTVTTLMVGYRTRLFDRPVDLNLNVSNALEEEYFRATTLASGAWGEPRQFRLTMRMSL